MHIIDLIVSLVFSWIRKNCLVKVSILNELNKSAFLKQLINLKKKSKLCIVSSFNRQKWTWNLCKYQLWNVKTKKNENFTKIKWADECNVLNKNENKSALSFSPKFYEISVEKSVYCLLISVKLISCLLKFRNWLKRFSKVAKLYDIYKYILTKCLCIFLWPDYNA